MDFIQRPVLWFETISKYRATSTAAPNFAYDYCLRTGRLPRETLENCDLSSLLVLMCAAEPVKPDTYTRFLETFEAYGLKSESFYVAYGLAENTLAVTTARPQHRLGQQACARAWQGPHDHGSLPRSTMPSRLSAAASR